MYRGRRMRHRWMQDPPDAVSPSRCRDARSEVERVDDDRGDDDARRGARANGRAYTARTVTCSDDTSFDGERSGSPIPGSRVFLSFV